jgi:hypothetical protein
MTPLRLTASGEGKRDRGVMWRGVRTFRPSPGGEAGVSRSKSEARPVGWHKEGPDALAARIAGSGGGVRPAASVLCRVTSGRSGIGFPAVSRHKRRGRCGGQFHNSKKAVMAERDGHAAALRALAAMEQDAITRARAAGGAGACRGGGEDGESGDGTASRGEHSDARPVQAADSRRAGRGCGRRSDARQLGGARGGAVAAERAGRWG